MGIRAIKFLPIGIVNNSKTINTREVNSKGIRDRRLDQELSPRSSTREIHPVVNHQLLSDYFDVDNLQDRNGLKMKM